MLDNSLTDSPKSSASTQMKTMALLARLMVERNCSGKQMAYQRSREMKARCWRCPVMASSTQQAHVFADVLGRAGALYGPRGVTEPPAPAPAATPARNDPPPGRTCDPSFAVQPHRCRFHWPVERNEMKHRADH